MTTERFRVVLVVPAGNPYAEGLREVAESIAIGLERSGRVAGPVAGDVDPGAINVVLNPQLLRPEAARALPEGTILCNFEQVHGDSPWMRAGYVDLVRRHVTWDYSARNVEAWRKWVPGARVVHVPVGYVPELARIAPAAEDIDVLFYGTMNARRERVLKALEGKGLRVVNAFGRFGAARDALIARARLVLNVHYYDSRIFEMPRVSYLLANRKAVVCEVAGDTDIEDDMRDAVAGVPYDGLVERCVALAGDAAARRALAERGFEVFSRRAEEEIVDRALSAAIPPALPESAPLPTRLVAGCGRRWRIDAVNLDLDPQWRPDLVADLAAPLPRAGAVDLGRFGRRPLPAGHFDEIRAFGALAKVADLATAMTSLLALLREGGTLVAEVPHEGAPGLAGRGMTRRSFRAFTDGYRELGWRDHRFEMVQLRHVLSDAGRKLADAGVPAGEILREPGAVLAMRVTLRKARVDDAGRAAAASGNAR